MKIKELKEEHPAIYKRALECQVEQGNKPNDELSLDACLREGNFHWDTTFERHKFWEKVYIGDFQVFYDRYPEHSKQPVNVEEKDWSKAPYELLKKCEMDYPHGTDALFGRCKRPGKVSWPLKFVECQGVSDNDRNMVFTFEYGFAEIVSQPKTICMDFSNDAIDSVAYVVHGLLPEPKAGDMVEVKMSDWVDFDTELEEYVMTASKGGSTSHLTFNGKFKLRDEIRLPKKSEVESKANELLVNVREGHYDHVGDQHMITKKWLIEKMIEIAKWGQQNTNAK